MGTCVGVNTMHCIFGFTQLHEIYLVARAVVVWMFRVCAASRYCSPRGSPGCGEVCTRLDRDHGSPPLPEGSGLDFAGSWRIGGYDSSFAARCCGCSHRTSSSCAAPLESCR